MKQLLITLSALALVLSVAYWWYKSHIGSDEPLQVRVRQIQGDVTKASAKGAAVPMSVGEVVSSGTRISTGGSSSVELSLGEQDSVVLKQNSELMVNELSDAVVSFELRQGEVEASVVRFQERSVEFGVAGNPIRIQTRAGALRLATDGMGSAEVVSLSGELNVSRPMVPPEKLSPGERLVVDTSGAELARGALPTQLLLEVQWPEETSSRAATLEVLGRTSPGAELVVGGSRVQVQRDGSFAAKVPLKEGGNRVQVEARGLAGSASSTSPEITRDSSPPAVRSRTDGLWK